MNKLKFYCKKNNIEFRHAENSGENKILTRILKNDTEDNTDSNYEGDIDYIFIDFTSRNRYFSKDTIDLSIEKNLRSLCVFDDWFSYQKEKKELLKDRNGMNAKEINIFFDQSEIVYVNEKEDITLNLEEQGINYLDYNSSEFENLKSAIYTIPFSEIFKLYNVTGNNLFKANVRQRKRGASSKTLREDFKESIHAYASIEFEDIFDEEEVLTNLTIYPQTKMYGKIDFWLKHNGITIYYEGENLKINASSITLSPSKAQVINGAQTLTNYFEIITELEDTLLLSLREKSNEIEKRIKKIQENMKIKVIFIENTDMDSYVRRGITRGLNNQIPLNIEDLVGDSEEVHKLNEKLIRKNIKISRSGEIVDKINNLDVMYAVKQYLTFKGDPGEARNLIKSNLDSYLKIMNTEFDDEKKIEEFKNYLFMAKNIDDNWKKKELYIKDTKLINMESVDSISRNGLYYFKSYSYKYKKSTENIEDFNFSYSDFILDMLDYLTATSEKKVLDSNDFKNDMLFDNFIKHKEEIKDKNNNEIKLEPNTGNPFEKLLVNVKDEINIKNTEENIIKSLKSKVLKEELEKLNLKLLNVRTITVDKLNMPTEAFAFSSHTFNEFVENANNIDSLKFEDSFFYEELGLERNFFVFIEQEKKIEKVIYLKFKFLDFKIVDDAKKTFEIVKSAFENQDIFLMPKVKDNISFHIRPKAVNASDTFEFTDGTFQTKRTFWANRTLIQEIIDSKK
ncbi:PDDEXK family nuclease [Carnobacterium maltaromaticum]|uniref:hypothetical protein n=2 Tax=Carnobacterium maltaromaticum TaxID=2751 RepID=UPI0010729AF2|nr:hypothetical protein [Carnobacterium maltaromaticum]TFJ72013.1 hypothetical protein CKN94_12515 [Carnobacterium maltaromaticum]TFJ76926.1 hypothetical protein CKN97_12505 [Carnobacterium maltaromaticum]